MNVIPTVDFDRILSGQVFNNTTNKHNTTQYFINLIKNNWALFRYNNGSCVWEYVGENAVAQTLIKEYFGNEVINLVTGYGHAKLFQKQETRLYPGQKLTYKHPTNSAQNNFIVVDFVHKQWYSIVNLDTGRVVDSFIFDGTLEELNEIAAKHKCGPYEIVK